VKRFVETGNALLDLGFEVSPNWTIYLFGRDEAVRLLRAG